MIKWVVFDSIKKFPPLLWNQKVSLGYAITSEQFLAAIEKTFPQQKFLYFVGYSNDKPVACALLNLCRVDLAIELPKQLMSTIHLFRKRWPNFLTLKIAMTGSQETYGSHFWYDESILDLSTFLMEFKKELSNHAKEYSALVLRDHISTAAQKMKLAEVCQIYQNASFTPFDFLPVAQVDISQFHSPDDFLSCMKSRDRYTLNKQIENSRKNGITFGFMKNYLDIIDECYPLYLAVNQKAHEHKSAPLPKQFFTDVKHEFGDDAYALYAKDRNQKLIAFGLIADRPKNMIFYVVGMDYERLKSDFSMYNLLWECIRKAIDDKRDKVDLGFTNYFVKQRLGAHLMPLTMFVQAKNPLVQRALKLIVKNNQKTGHALLDHA